MYNHYHDYHNGSLFFFYFFYKSIQRISQSLELRK